MPTRTHRHLSLDGSAFAVIVVAGLLLAGLIAAFILSAADSSERVLLAAVAVVVLQVVLVLAIAAATLGQPRTRLYGAEALVFAAGLTVLAAAIVVGGAGSGAADALRSPLAIAAVLMVVLFDSGRPATRVDRWVTVPSALLALLVFGAIFLLGPVTVSSWSGVFCLEGCPPTGFSASAAPGLQEGLQVVYIVLRGVMFVGLGAGLWVRTRRASGVQRARLLPVAIVGWLVVLAGLMGVIAALASPQSGLPQWLQPGSFTRVLVPVGLGIALVAGHSARRRLASDLEALRLSGDVSTAEAIVRRALADPTARVVPSPASPLDNALQGEVLRGADGAMIGILVTQPERRVADPETYADVISATTFALEAIALDRRMDELEADLTRARADSQAVADEARRQVEQALHDTAQARIVLLRGHLRRLAADAVTPSAQVQEELVLLATQADTALADIRVALMGVRPIPPGQLVPALRDDVRALSIPVAVDDRGIGALPADAELAVHFGVREALQNALKHAGERASIRISLGRDPTGFAWVEVTDDGSGFIPGTAPERGLAGLRHRLRGVGGDLHVRSAPGRGTTVRMTVPLAMPQAPSDVLSR